jgi:guanine deaminase
MMRTLIRGQLVGFSDSSGKISLETEGVIAFGEDGRIAWVGPQARLPLAFGAYAEEDYGDKFLLPGFVDAHIHFPQYRMLAAPAKDLLEWLNRYTFPEEARYADAAYSMAAADVFLKRLFSHGTTAALAFCSVHKQSVDALFTVASKANMALVTGKTMMDRNAIPAVQDTAEQGARESEFLYNQWHGKNRLRYAVTPRFAVTSSDAQLAVSGDLLKALPGALLQTHISESPGEIALVQSLFPNAIDYTDVYEQYGLLTDHSLFAHGIHLSERELKRLKEKGSTVVHCPTSNAFLGSGIMRMPAMEGIHLGLGTDVGGGTSYSMLATMGEAYKLQMLGGYKPSVYELFRMATLGNAERLRIDHETGSLEVGKFADVIVLDSAATPVLESRQELSQSIEDVLFSLMMLGDDRAITATYVAGQLVHKLRSGRSDDP